MSSGSSYSRQSENVKSNPLLIRHNSKHGHVGNLFKFRSTADNIILCCGITFAICQGLLPPINMLLLGKVVTAMGSPELDTSVFVDIIRGFACLAAAGFVSGTLNAALFELVAARQIKSLKTKYMAAITRQDISLFDTIDVGTLAADIEQTCVHVRDGTGMKLGIIFQAAAQFLAGYAVGLTKSWQMTLVLGSSVPIMGIVVGLLMLRLRKATEISKRDFEAANSIAEEALSSMRTVACFSGEEHVVQKFEERLDVSLKSETKTSYHKAFGLAVMFTLLFLSYAFGWWYAGMVVHDGIIDMQGEDDEVGGDVVTVFFAIMIASYSLSQLMPNIGAVIVASKSVVPVHAMVQRIPMVDPYSTAGVAADDITGEIVFKDLMFAYPSRPDRPVYSDVSFSVNEGETVALVGPSGCGKSTIVQLLERFYSPSSGSIILSGVPIYDYNVQSLRHQMALVSQEPRLYADTIFKNIEYGKKGASMEEVVLAAQKANAHNFIMSFPQQYMTNVGEGGSMLSGGQKQRIAIARAILRDPKILVLDEATSALDNESEKIVQEALDQLVRSKKRTTIIIAHRLTTIRNADRIVVFENPEGRGSKVVENGSHDELMAIPDGLYRALVQAQDMSKKGGYVTGVTEEMKREELLQQLGTQYNVGYQVSAKTTAVASMLRKYSKGAPTGSSEIKSQLYMPPRKPSLTEAASKLVKETAESEVPIIEKHARKVLPLMKDDWLIYVFGVIAAAITGFSWPIASALIAQFIGIFFSYDDSQSPEANADYCQHKSNMLSAIFAGIAVIVGLSYFVQQACFGYSGERLVSRVRRKVFKTLVYQDMEFFDSPHHGTGHLCAILSADCATLRAVSGDNLAIIIQNAMTIIAAILISFFTYAKLAAVCTAAFFLVVPANLLQARLLRVQDVRSDLLDNAETTAFVMHETVTSLRTIAAYGLQEEMHNRYTQKLDQEFRVERKNAWITGLTAGFAAGIMFAGNALSYWYGGTLLADENSGLDLTECIRTILVLMMAANGIGRSTTWAADSKRAKTSISNVWEVLNKRSKVDVRDPHGLTLPIEGALDFRGLRFRYPYRPESQVLENVSFSIDPGETVAIVGGSGCGKSTVIQLLERFYDLEPSAEFCSTVEMKNSLVTSNSNPPTFQLGRPDDMFDGEILADGRDICDYNIKYWRSCLGLVPQEPGLFSTSVRENIRWGKWDATDEEIEAAARLANADSFICKFPNGYDEDVGKYGCKLSGGQKQRVAIARAIIRNPKILLLDEATSALDRESEQIVQVALDDLVSQKRHTTIIIAHRLSTIRSCDKIVVLQCSEPGVGSTVVEMGTHDQLMQINNGVYRHLVEISDTHS